MSKFEISNELFNEMRAGATPNPEDAAKAAAEKARMEASYAGENEEAALKRVEAMKAREAAIRELSEEAKRIA